MEISPETGSCRHAHLPYREHSAKKIFEWSQRPLPFSPRSRKHIHTHASTLSHFRFYTLFGGVFLITCKYNVNVDNFVMHFIFVFKVVNIMFMMAVFLLHSFLSRKSSNRLLLLCLSPSFSHSLAHFFCAWQPGNDQLPTVEVAAPSGWVVFSGGRVHMDITNITIIIQSRDHHYLLLHRSVILGFLTVYRSPPDISFIFCPTRDTRTFREASTSSLTSFVLLTLVLSWI